MKRLIWISGVLLFLATAGQTAQGFEHFVTRDGDKLMDGASEYRFISFNIPNLHYVEDNLPFDQVNPWRLPDEFEITDALTAIRQMGGRVARVYTLSVRRADDTPDIPRHVLGPGRFNEEAFVALDKVLEVANKTGVRVIIPFVDNWIWWGGIREYAVFRGKEKDAFWTDPQVMADFKKTIEFVIDRKNTFTGVRYKDDKAILAWETGNELQSPAAWTHQIAQYIKQLDGNHLVIDGFHTPVLRDASIDDPAVDIVTTHHYPKNAREMIDQVKANQARTKGKKPYFVGEFGFVETPGIAELLDVVIEGNASGALIWSLRYRSRDGGFYWHSEPFGGDRYKAYHWPGFDTGRAYDEREILALMRSKAYEIQGRGVPELPTPPRPVMLPIEDVSAISWQGSAGAESYTVQRAPTKDGPWTVVGRDISDAALPYRPLFNDTGAPLGRKYYYRVIAQNRAHASRPSKAVGPVTVECLTLVDELDDLSMMAQHDGVALETGKTRQAKEDMDRVKGDKGAFLVYKTPGPVTRCKVYVFFPEAVTSLDFHVSPDGQSYTPVPAKRHDYFSGEGEYGYFKPVAYEVTLDSSNARYVKIDFGGPVQVARIEIAYGENE